LIISTKTSQGSDKENDTDQTKDGKSAHVITKTYKQTAKTPANTDNRPTKKNILNVLQ